MPRQLLFTVSTAALLIGLYAAYALTVSSAFIPEELHADLEQPRDPLPAPAPPRNREMAAQWIKNHPWVADAKYQVRTDKAFLYAEDWEKVEPSGQVRFHPFALIYTREEPGQPPKPPLVVVSESALLTFENPFDDTNPKPGRVIGGALDGPFEVLGADGLTIKGRTIHFSEAALKAWSDNPIEFTFGASHGTGVGLEMDLLPGPRTTDKPGISGLKTLRLLKDVALNLQNHPKSPDKKPEQITITCAGNFEYQLESRLATFKDRVHVEHPTDPTHRDILDCMDLLLEFEQEQAPTNGPTGTSVPEKERISVAGDRDADLKFRRMRAQGAPARLVSQRSELVALCTELTYDAQTRTAVLKDPKEVKATQNLHDLTSPDITVVHAEGGKILEAICRGAGHVESYASDAARPGQRGPLAFSAQWTQQLHRRPDSGQTLDLIEITGQAELKQPGKLTLNAETVQIWMTPDGKRIDKSEPAAPSVAVTTAAGTDAVATDPAAAGAKNADGIRPASAQSTGASKKTADRSKAAQVERVVGIKDVRFASPELKGRTQKLEITVVPGTLPRQPPPDSTPPAGRKPDPMRQSQLPFRARTELLLTSDLRPRASTTREARIRGWAYVADEPSPAPAAAGRPKTVRTAGTNPSGVRPLPNDPSARTLPAGTEPPAQGSLTSEKKSKRKPPSDPALVEPPAPREPLDVTADDIQVQMIRDGEQTEVAEVITEGHVLVKQPREAGQPPVEVLGDWLKLWNYSETQQIVHVIGKPAIVNDPQMRIEGQDLHLDRGRNRAWVEGAGELSLPVNRSLDGQALTQPQRLKVRWKERMNFDGLLARFLVDVTATLNDSRMDCQEMEVTLSRAFSFTEKSSSSQAAEVQTVHCQEGVEVIHYEYDPQRKLKSLRRASAWEFTLNQITGETTALGPGKLLVWWKGDANRAGLSATASVQANRAKAADAHEWNYARIDFADSMRGNTKSKLTEFHERVQVIYGPVDNYTSVIDPEKLPLKGGWLKCDQLRLSQLAGSGKKEFLEMFGQGNSELDGRTSHGYFHSLADTITYDESKGLYILRAEGSREATLWRQSSLSAPTARVDAQRMEFNPELNQLKLHRTSGLDGLK